MEALLTEIFTNPDNLWVGLPVAHHLKKYLWRCYTKGSYRRANRGKIGGTSERLRRLQNFAGRCHYGHKTGPWRRGGPNVW